MTLSLCTGLATASATQPAALSGTFKSRRKRLYPGGPWVSPLGFGTYRVGFSPQLGAPEGEKALLEALKRGVNLIDTSSNYGNGQSELLIGKVLRECFDSGTLKRENVVVVTKAGYIQGNNKELVDARVRSGAPFPEVEEFTADLSYCIHPSFLRDQINRSKERLGLETLDVFLLHNPEYLLKKWETTQQAALPNSEANRVCFLEKIAESFRFLEVMVEEGHIGCYGVSSNTLGYPAEDPTHVNLKELLSVANSIAGAGHHFRVVQFPMNWIEILPLVFPVEPNGPNTLQFAAQNGIGILLNRPLNAMHNDGLIRLSRPTVPEGVTLDQAAQNGLQNWTQLSSDLESVARKHIDVPGYEAVPLSQYVLSTLMWQPEVSSVLLGMRKLRYVDDAAETLQRPALLKASQHLSQIYNELEFYREDSAENPF
jgi:aryl-alcohol dehydrogenase-like predicted oxidoreductase